HTTGLTPHQPTPTPHTTPHLPTYPFQHHHYWLDSGADGVDDVAAAGLDDAGHPLLAAVADLPESGGVLATGRIRADADSWLGGYLLEGTPVLPAVGILDLVLSTMDGLGLQHLDELVVDKPIVVPARGGTDLRVQVTGGDADGRRTVLVHTRQAGAWTRHAAGVLGTTPGPADVPGPGPAPATADQLDLLTERLASAGYDHDGAYRSIRAFHGEYADVALPDDVDADGFGFHPALLAAALDGMLSGLSAETLVPSRFTDVRLHATGATSATVRARTRADGTVAVGMVDATGAPLLTIGSVASRPLTAADVTVAADEALASPLAVDWVRIPVPDDVSGAATVFGDLEEVLAAEEPTDVPAVLLLRVGQGQDPDAGPEAAHAVAERTLHQLQQWLTNPHLTHTHLVILT
ncbi:polyketide synthase dehydratase domain-containing protein, partial [Micromonospora haikouensis]|uniref:polyketide synthase dehydratase domain-containing protein n=2 Tax=Micromonospora TaxID=1873 RepID=UPI0033C2FC2E